jgi:hypothetical protein
MPPRLVEQFPVGAPVLVAFEDRCGTPAWVPGVVVRHARPAVWVRTADGREWYVTSGKRIRMRAS